MHPYATTKHRKKHRTHGQCPLYAPQLKPIAKRADGAMARISGFLEIIQHLVTMIRSHGQRRAPLLLRQTQFPKTETISTSPVR